MKCPYCGAKLHKIYGNDFDCPNSECKGCYPLPLRFWQDLIDGKKAQRQLRSVKDRCVKKVKAKEREIDNYWNGIRVRQGEIETLEKQLKQAQDEIIYLKGLNCPTVVEKQMQTITTCAKQLDIAVAALKEIVTNPHGAACHNYARAKEALKEIEDTKE